MGLGLHSLGSSARELAGPLAVRGERNEDVIEPPILPEVPFSKK